jgi:hypothetical protein
MSNLGENTNYSLPPVTPVRAFLLYLYGVEIIEFRYIIAINIITTFPTESLKRKVAA